MSLNKIFSIISLVVVFFYSCNSNKQNNENHKKGDLSKISFTKTLFDFGKIPVKKDAIAVFNFSNAGGSPLIITDVKTTCGCTVPKYPKEPLKPDEMAEIKVIYDAKFPGRFSKTISVYYNGKDSPKILTVKGEEPYPEEVNTVNP